MAKKFRPAWLAPTQCTGKHRFESAGLAMQVARQSARRKDSKASAYRCATCGGWHIGNGNGKQSINRKQAV